MKIPISAPRSAFSALGAGLALLLAFLILPAARAQSAASTAAPEPQFPTQYDMSKETQVKGTIQKIDNSGDMLPLGVHLLVQTSSGVVDAHLGYLNKASFQALNLSTGQAVALTGMEQTTPSGSLFVVRLLTTSSHVIVLRNERGAPVRSLLPRGSFNSAFTKGGR